MSNPRISIVAAMGLNRELGLGNRLLWHIPDDLKRFKEITLGHPVIMGRKTFESIVSMLGKPFPNRTNIVVTRDPDWHFDGAMRASSIQEAIEKAQELNNKEIFIEGGADIWRQSIEHADKLYLTLINDSQPADAFFPDYEHLFTKKVFEEKKEWNGLTYTWIDLER
jgi:dihydrofolate reductase